MNLIWFAGLVFVGGSLIALWPDAREERRLAERYAGCDGAGMSAALVVGACSRSACVLLVALPVPARADSRPTTGSYQPDELEQRRLALAEERDRALAALKELEFDHRTGKVSDDDYRELVGPLRRRAAETLARARRCAAAALQQRRSGCRQSSAADGPRRCGAAHEPGPSQYAAADRH